MSSSWGLGRLAAPLLPVMAWAVYVGAGWAIAPRWCDTPALLHTVSGALVVVSVLATVITASRARLSAPTEDGSPGTVFTLGLAFKLGVLFTGGIIAAWVLAASWCG